MASDNLGTHARSPDLLQNQGTSPGSLSCSVCLEVVTEAGERSTARLKCGHYFHLDCIGSAFNIKGAMQCPNCRQVEHGRWLYANGCHLHEDLMEDLIAGTDYEVQGETPDLDHYPGHVFGHVPWCPFQQSHPDFSASLLENDNLATDLEGFSMEGPLHFVPSLTNSNNGRALHFPSRDRSTWLQQTSASSSTSAAHENSLPSGERPRQPYPNGLHGARAYFQNAQLVDAGFHQVPYHPREYSVIHPEILGNATNGIDQFHPQSIRSTAYNGYTGRMPRQRPAILAPHRVARNSTSDQPRMYAHRTWESIGSGEQNSNNHLRQGEVRWQVNDQAEPWIRGQAYATRGSAGTPYQWCTWVPPGANAVQNVLSNTASSSHHVGQFYSGNGSLHG
eukprot:c26331_g1_i1 orf=403-1578(-)